MQDLELIERVLSGHESAQREFYDRHLDRVYALAYRMTGNETWARECTQSVFIRLFDKLDTFRGQAALSTWVHTVAVSVILQWRRSTARVRERETVLEAADDVAVSCSAFDRVVDESIRRAVDDLPALYRAVVDMHDLEGYTHDEIGAALGITPGASKVRLSRARKRLKHALAEYAGDLAYEQ